uniref:Kazal-like domain-containing protein n=1 Tax=Biomphalaria glabrata TaxID=6526 RepID=A0A2C9L7D2_BIOGL
MFKLLLYLTFLLLGSAVKDVSGQVTQPPCNLACTFIYRPVCASNGLTYANICTMESISCIDSLGLTLRHEGPCV